MYTASNSFFGSVNELAVRRSQNDKHEFLRLLLGVTKEM